ncbi:MAG: hypothetical protein WBK58_05825, partial [Dethiobacteria bacterium]
TSSMPRKRAPTCATAPRLPSEALTRPNGGSYFSFTVASPGRVQQLTACQLAPSAGSLWCQVVA